MKTLEQIVDGAARAMALDEQALARRKAFLGLEEEDLYRLRTLHAAMQAGAAEFVDAFYDHLRRFEEPRALLPDAAALERLKRAHLRYFATLTAGDYGPQYLRDRLRVGVVHQRIGLAPEWYIGAYAQYLARWLPQVWQLTGRDPQAFLATCQALAKIVLLDMGLAIDAYIHIDRQTARALKAYTEIAFANIPDGLLVLSEELRILSANRAFLDGFALPAEAVKGRYLFDVVTAEGLRERALEVLATGIAQHGVPFALRTAATAEKSVRITLAGIQLAEEEEEEARLLVIVQDLTQEEALRTAALESERRFRDLAETAHDAIFMTDGEGRIVYFNRAAERLFGYRRHQLLTQPIETVLIEAPVCPVGHGRTPSNPIWESQARRQDGAVFPVEGAVSMFEGAAGRYITYVVRDLTERKQFEDQLRYLANHDPLTGLPNRTLFQERLRVALERAEREGRLVAVLFLDLDRFKRINDTLGHLFGDRVLSAVAERLEGCIRQGDTLSRLGGDEFIVCLEGLADRHGVDRVAHNLLEAMSRPLHVDGREIAVAVSVGIALYPLDADDTDTLLKRADTAMYHAKAQGHHYQFYTPDMEVQTSERFVLENDLRQALERGEFLLHYQPHVAIGSGRVTGLEALLRWRHPTRGLISPAQFIPLAEESGLIVPLGEWVLRTACAQIKAWQGAGLPPLPVAVNLSALQFRQRNLLDAIDRIVRESGIEPAYLELEITETVLMQNLAVAASTLQALGARGMHISIDDFGTGYSSLSYLKRLPIDTLKIAQEFVQDLAHDPDDAAIVQAVIALAHSLHLRVIAEGVETQEQYEFLRAQGCDEIQGYYFSKPRPAEEILEVLRNPVLLP